MWIGVFRKFSPLQDSASPGGTLPTELPVLGAGAIALLSPKSRALAWGWLAEEKLTFIITKLN